jgi:hypothetical protein
VTDDLSERERRLGLNEALFREVNERLKTLGRHFDLGNLDLICECGRSSCAERITMSPADYEQLRSDPTLFAIASGHQIEDVEDVVADRQSYAVIRKHAGGEAQLATQTDPRS